MTLDIKSRGLAGSFSRKGFGRKFNKGSNPVVSYDAAATALFARMTVQPNSARKTLINNLIVALKACGAWSQLDMLYIIAAHDAQAARLNWIGTSAGQGQDLTVSGSPVFTADHGYLGDGISALLNTGILQSGLTKFLQNSCSWGLGNRNEVVPSSNQWFFGCTSSGTVNGFNASSGSSSGVRVSATISVARTDASKVGRYYGTRTDSANATAYKNGVSLGTFAQTSAAPNAANTTILSTASNPSTAEATFFFMGAYFDATTIAAIDSAISTYLTAVGA